MDTDDIIRQIHSAKKSHISWIMKADAIIYGIPVEEDQVPLNGTECIFGKWYYGPGQAISHMPSYKAIEQPHFDLHSTYTEIFNILFKKKDKSWLRKLFGSNAQEKVSDEQRQQARALFPTLKKHSEVVVGLLEQLEQEVLALS